ncbi:TPA: 30S ribosomal protein S3 [Candidatus Bathyarchaeota archaeon]|nr:30S ribosomal protein S3 [Candidatus Bathyarchaeota archaeon]HIJ09002.1 30S ribosomal protein S3 [Candidatus Bathyarchaeota archaeon]
MVKRFITESIKRAEIDEFLQKKLERAGYGGVNLSKTPLGTHVVVYAMRPGIVIGRGGETIRELATVLEQNFKVANPQISVSEIEFPELNAFVVASRVASALERGIHFRRAAFWALNQVMDAGALGVEIVISGKLRTERARFEKFRAGDFPRCGEPALRYMRKAEMHVQLKPGMIGVRVKLMPPDAQFPDKIQITIPDVVPEEEIHEEITPETRKEPAEATQQGEAEENSAETTEVKEVADEPPGAAEPVKTPDEADAAEDAAKSAETGKTEEAT